MTAVASSAGGARRLPAVVLGLVRVDARRSASWVVAAATLAVVALVSPSRLDAAAASGVLLAVAAIGGLVRAPPATELMGLRLGARLVWPLGAAVASLVACGRDDMAGRALVATAVVAAGVVTAGAVAVVKRLRPVRHLLREAVPEERTFAGHGSAVGRSRVDAAAMASALVAMAVCFFLVPEWAGWYVVVATSWFTVLAVPIATFAGGDETLRRDLVATAPGRPRLAGTPGGAGSILAAYATILGWPAAVAAIVVRHRGWGWGDPLAALVALACMATVAAALAWGAAARRWREDSTFVAMAAAHAVAIAAIPGAT